MKTRLFFSLLAVVSLLALALPAAAAPLKAGAALRVITPDPLAIENFYLFLKNLKFRQLSHVLSALGLRERARRAG